LAEKVEPRKEYARVINKKKILCKTYQ